MNLNFFKCIGYATKWLGWCWLWLVTCPLATLMLIALLISWSSPITPGHALMNFVESVDSGGSKSAYVYPRCSSQILTVLMEGCPRMTTNAEGYAAYLDSTLKIRFVILWSSLALFYAAFAWGINSTPAQSRQRTLCQHCQKHLDNKLFCKNGQRRYRVENLPVKPGVKVNG